MTPYTYQRGETISLALDAVTGDPADVSAISAAMKPILARADGGFGGCAFCGELCYVRHGQHRETSRRAGH